MSLGTRIHVIKICNEMFTDLCIYILTKIDYDMSKMLNLDFKNMGVLFK